MSVRRLPLPEDREIQLRRYYKNIFSTVEGQEVAKDLIVDILGAFRDDCITEGDIALSNTGRYLLNMIGCSDGEITINEIMKAVLRVPALVYENNE